VAEMIPESISSTQDATPGEKRVFRLLRDALQPDDDFLVWFEPKPVDVNGQKRRTDFLIWSQEFGLLVMEVKDWVTAQIIEMSPLTWKILRDGKLETRDSPVEQARSYFKGCKGLLAKDRRFCQPDGVHVGNLKFPIGYCAVFTNVTRRQASECGITKVETEAFCIFSDDLIFDVQQRDDRSTFIAKLKQAFAVRFNFEPLTHDELKVLRHTIFPEVRVNNIRPLRSGEDVKLIQTLDLEQERTAKSIAEGHRVLKGVAGSGKSLVIACRAKFLKRLHPDWRILIVCYGIPMVRYLQQLLNISDQAQSADGIEVIHYHGLVKCLTNVSLKKESTEISERWDARVGRILRGAIADGRVRQRYEAILVDEGQDLFAVEWLQSLIELLNPQTDSFLLCLDPQQNIFGRKVTYKSAGIKVQGKRPIHLKTSYRNTVEILELARKFARMANVVPPPEEEETLDSLLFPIDTNRHGEQPVLIQGKVVSEQIAFILNQIDQFISAGECSWCDIGVLYGSPLPGDFPASFAAAFTARFGNDKLYHVTESRESKMGFDITAQSVKLSTIESAKGTEFRVVFVVGLEMLPRRDRDAESERNLVYVGLTRAQDQLYVLGNATSGLFGELLAVSEMSMPMSV
jgi:hypothetical protein